MSFTIHISLYRIASGGVALMQLYIVRHGIAIDREDPKCPPDPERFLTPEGIEKAKQVARGVAEIGAVPDLMLSSPYVRAFQTAEIFATALEFSKSKIRRSELLLPGAEPLQLFRELSRDKQSSSVFLFGHAPHLDDILATAVGSKHHITSLKKAGVALVELTRLVPPSGQLLWLATPKLLRKAGK
jgi:phosphohistidine phosphatase